MKLISIKELSQFLSIKESTLYAWVHNGTIPFYKLNGLLRFDLEKIEEWVKDSKPTHQRTNIELKRAKTQDIDLIVKNAVESVTGKGYNPTKRETSLNQGLRKEVSDGAV